jgi:hypothetical protein
VVTTSKLSKEEHRKSALFARLTYAAIIVTFVTLCTVAVVVTMNEERNKKGFRAIKVTQPISFIDRTYLDGKPADQH